MSNTIKKNEKCFIGLPACGYGFESAKLCFVACPSDEKYIIKLELIKSIVESKQYECHIALHRIDPGNFAFCTKICSKIVQSQFCIVLLDPSIDKEGKEFYNPNPLEVVIVEVPEMQFLMIDGMGSPGDSKEYLDALAALYPIAFKTKFLSKSKGKD